MYPVFLNFGFIHIYSYGLMVAIAFLVSTFLLNRYAVSLGWDKDFFWNLSFWILWGGILGGRLLYIIFNPDFFLKNPLEAFRLWHGGLIWYGGGLGGVIACILYLKLKKKTLFTVLDIIVPFAALGQAIGRIGCFLNGCCYGYYLIPSQLFSSLGLLLIFVILRIFQDRPRQKGSILAGYLFLASLERFVEEFLRNDSPRGFWGLTIFQLISLGILFSAIILWFMILRQKKKTPVNV